MARTIYPNKYKKNPFPLWKDSIYQSLKTEQQKFVYNMFLQPITNWTNVQCFLDATTRNIKKSTANTYTSQMLNSTKIQHCINKVKKHYRRQLRITPERILKEEACIALSDIGEFFNDEGLLTTKPSDLPPRVRRAISGFKRKTIAGVEYYEVTLWSKGDSLKRLQKVMAMNAPTEHKLSGDVNVNATIVHKIDLSTLSDFDISTLKDIQKKLKIIDKPLGDV